MSEEKIVLTVSSIAWAISWHYTSVTVAAMDHGYTQEMLPGDKSAHWVKE